MYYYFTRRNRFFLLFKLLGLNGLYLIVWTFIVQKEMRAIDRTELHPVLLIAICILSLGVYGAIWHIRISRKFAVFGGGDQSAQCRLLSCLLIGVLFNPFVIQGQINRASKNSCAGLTEANAVQVGLARINEGGLNGAAFNLFLPRLQTKLFRPLNAVKLNQPKRI